MKLPNLKYYYIDSQISSGGTAAVYRGVDLRSGYEVAIKALFPHRAKDTLVKKRFMEEANHYLYLSHPNITKLVDFIEDGNNYYLVIEYVDGIPLDEYVKSTGPLSDNEIVTLFIQVLDTIAYLHQNRVLHLDIKPNNMMVTETSDGSKKIKILDMGISAKINDKSNNLKKCGSPAFMAPEQINQGKLGFFTDIFALGVTLFNIITMKLPFVGDTHTEIFEKICKEPTPSIKDFCETVNPLYQPIIERALNKNGEDRYQTCEEFMMDMYSIIDKKSKKTKK